MTTLHFTRTTTATAQQLLEALTYFAPGRSALFPNSLDEFLTVHAWGDDCAEITEGGRGTWERLHYDWSDPTMVIATTTNSNVWGGRSGHTYMFSPLPDGTTRVDVVAVREGKNLKGLFLAALLASIGRKVLEQALDHTIKAIETRNDRQTSELPGALPVRGGASSIADATGRSASDERRHQLVEVGQVRRADQAGADHDGLGVRLDRLELRNPAPDHGHGSAAGGTAARV
jgi:hypothetical protein